VKIVAGEKIPAFSGENLDARITLFNDKLVSKINDDHWREVLSQCIPEGMDDIQSGNEHGDVVRGSVGPILNIIPACRT
jgi:hypothetical protein